MEALEILSKRLLFIDNQIIDARAKLFILHLERDQTARLLEDLKVTLEVTKKADENISEE
jgi:hypothetical protein